MIILPASPDKYNQVAIYKKNIREKGTSNKYLNNTHAISTEKISIYTLDFIGFIPIHTNILESILVILKVFSVSDISQLFLSTPFQFYSVSCRKSLQYTPSGDIS